MTRSGGKPPPACRGCDSLIEGRDQRLRPLVAEFLRDKAITSAAGPAPERGPAAPLGHVVLPAAARVRPRRPARLVASALVYPQAFRVQRNHGCAGCAARMGRRTDPRGVGTWPGGPVLGRRARRHRRTRRRLLRGRARDRPRSMLDGAMDGTPPLPRDWQRQWADDFQRAYEALCADVDADRETAIDPYAAESPEEFFAVCTEHHFSDAGTLRRSGDTDHPVLRRISPSANPIRMSPRIARQFGFTALSRSSS